MAQSIRIQEFDTWRPGYAGASVRVYQAGTTTNASLFYNPDLTGAAPNPITLETKTVDGVEFGRFAQPLYVGVPYQVLVDGVELTGIQRLPVYDLAGADVSESVATSARGTVSRTIEEWLDDVVHVAAFGALGVNATTNTTILTTAIGVAAAQGGGEVLVPAGTYPFNTLSIPQGVILRGQGARTTILQSTQGQEVITLAGNYSGLHSIQIDGQVQTAGSVGVYAVGRTGLVLRDTIIDGFVKGVEYRGAQAPIFENVDVVNCDQGADIRGDTDAGDSGDGGTVQGLRWIGGRIADNTTFGLRLLHQDAAIERVDLRNLIFDTNVGAALKIEGAQMVQVAQSRWLSNTACLSIEDGADDDKTEASLITFDQALFQTGTITFAETCEKIMFRACDFDDVDINFAVPANNILFLDCIERVTTTATGNTDRLTRTSNFRVQETFGVTTDATPTNAWKINLASGQHVRARARVIGRARTGPNTASYEFNGGAVRESSRMNFVSPSGSLVAGLIITGNTSGATARAVVIEQATPPFYIDIRDVVGTFINGETVTFSDAKTCVLSSAEVLGNIVLTGTVTQVAPTFESNSAWNATFVTDGDYFYVQVTGEASLTVEWFVQVDVFLS